jgi:oxygen-independent coproporphyrinogen III oxidase
LINVHRPVAGNSEGMNADVAVERPSVLPDLLDDALLARMDRPGPRYTSYPTADRFDAGFGRDALMQACEARRNGPLAGAPLSLYVHVPFCASVCYYCACNKVVTKDRSKVAPYLMALREELQRMHTALGDGVPASQVHFGGGTPTYLDDEDLAALMDDLRARFPFTEDLECSIEIDPRTVSTERLARLRAMGFNRVSFGVQDIDPDVQVAVHRLQPLAQVQALMAAARALGFASINVDLIYGLPRQTPRSFAETVAAVAQLRPDRIAMYGYAHLPERFKPQRRIVDAELPRGADRLQMLGGAITGFLAAGYDYIGMDHFALPQDPLAQAKRAGRLHRNFQGYSTQPDCDLVALGVSAISRIGRTYSQNPKTLEGYYAALEQPGLPVERGLALSDDDASGGHHGHHV